MRQQWVMGNWKMNGSRDAITTLVNTLKRECAENALAQCVVFPPAIYMPLVSELLQGTSIAWGAQNVFTKDAGAYTGEHAASMLKEYQCQFVLVGHSERRHLFHEDAKFVAEKFHQVKDHDMIPVLCVGETLSEREQGKTEAVLEHQLSAILRDTNTDFKRCVIAYEPVWAIGTGQTATPAEAEHIHAYIRAWIAKHHAKDAENISILYGGSVNERNARDLFSMQNVDGGLVGGVSLQAQPFLEIVKCINSL